MKIKDFEFPLYLVKFCEKEEYADSLLAGNLYMKASGYFRNLPGENAFRGDPYDGKFKINIGDEIAYIETEDGERIYLNGVPGVKMTSFVQGFEGDDKIPIFCACLLDDSILEKTGETSFRIKRQNVEHLEQFGAYAVFIPLGELVDKLEKYHEQNPDIFFTGKKVSYIDLENSEEEIPEDRLEAFFRKDTAYKEQNEWRLLAYAADHELIEESDAWICDVGAFQYAVKIPTAAFAESEFHIGENQASTQIDT